MAEFIQLVEKKPNSSVSILDTKLGLFVDNSGSTSGSIGKYGNILGIELNLLKLFVVNKKLELTLWNSVATFRKPGYFNRFVANGGTQPSSIMTNISTKESFETCDPIVFTTDGEIQSHEITNFANCIKNIIPNKTIICVLVNDSTDFEHINISVFAPFLMAKNVLICHYVDKLTILHTKGYFKEQFRNFQKYDLDTLLKLDVITNATVIPSGSLVLSETETHVITYNLDTLLLQETFDISSIRTEDWDNIIQNAKLVDKLSQLRERINVWRNDTIRKEMAILKETSEMPITKRKNELIELITKTDDSEQKKVLSSQLSGLLAEANAEEIRVMKNIHAKMSIIRSYWDVVRQTLHHYESASYSLNDMTYSSNRAARAKQVSMEDEFLTNVSIHESVPEIDCAIHLDKGPAVLWLRNPDNFELTTNDHVLNFPLDSFHDISNCLVLNPVCGLCASGYMKAIQMSVYREPINGFIPLDFKNNRHAIHAQLCKILCNGKDLPHVKMLLLSIVDDSKLVWLDSEVKKHIVQELLKHTWTTETFTEEGTKVPLLEAIKKLTNLIVINQPLNAVLRMLKFCRLNDPTVNKEKLVMLARNKFAYRIIEVLLSVLLKESSNVIGDKINHLLYDYICGIQCIDDTHPVHLPNLNQVYELIRVNDQTRNNILEFCSCLELESDQVFTDQFLSLVLFNIKNIVQHERPLTVYQNLCVRNKSFNTAMSNFDLGSKQDVVDYITNETIGRYHVLDQNIFYPPFAIYNGEFSCCSKLFFQDKPIIEHALVVSFDKFMENLRIQLDEKMRLCYGTTIPSQYSGHSRIHKIVASILETKYPVSIKPTVKMIASCLQELEKTKGLYGNIFNQRSCVCMIYAIYDFLELRRTHKNYYVDQDSMRFEHKLLAELDSCGIKIIDNIVQYDPSLLTKSQTLLKKYDLDIKQILFDVEEYMNSIDKTIEKKIIDIILPDVIEINVSSEQMNTEKWAEEQNAIVNQLSFVDKYKLEDVKYIAGMDVSFSTVDTDLAVASLVIFSYPENEIIAKVSIKCKTNIPYMAGYLAFREVPILAKLIEKTQENIPEFMPQIIIMDGNGVWHPRMCGIASHFGVITGIPCIGVAKKVLVADGITTERVNVIMHKDAPHEGDMCEIRGDSGNILGMGFNVTGTVENSIYMSLGHNITMDSAIKLIKHVTKYKVTEPVRQADLLSRSLI